MCKIQQNCLTNLHMNLNTSSKNYNKVHKIRTNKIFEKHNNIRLRNITCSHKNFHISFKIYKNVPVTFKIFKKCNYDQLKDHSFQEIFTQKTTIDMKIYVQTMTQK